MFVRYTQYLPYIIAIVACIYRIPILLFFASISLVSFLCRRSFEIDKFFKALFTIDLSTILNCNFTFIKHSSIQVDDLEDFIGVDGRIRRKKKLDFKNGSRTMKSIEYRFVRKKIGYISRGFLEYFKVKGVFFWHPFILLWSLISSLLKKKINWDFNLCKTSSMSATNKNIKIIKKSVFILPRKNNLLKDFYVELLAPYLLTST